MWDPGGGWPLVGLLGHLAKSSQSPAASLAGSGPVRRDKELRRLSQLSSALWAPLGGARRVRPRRARPGGGALVAHLGIASSTTTGGARDGTEIVSMPATQGHLVRPYPTPGRLPLRLPEVADRRRHAGHLRRRLVGHQVAGTGAGTFPVVSERIAAAAPLASPFRRSARRGVGSSGSCEGRGSERHGTRGTSGAAARNNPHAGRVFARMRSDIFSTWCAPGVRWASAASRRRSDVRPRRRGRRGVAGLRARSPGPGRAGGRLRRAAGPRNTA